MKNIFHLIIIQLLMFPVQFANANPFFDGKKLMISNVDSIDRVAMYQDVIFSFTQEGQWKLLSFEIGIEEDLITNVELIQTDTLPIQVFLKITGTLISSCPKEFRIQHRMIDNTFEVAMYNSSNSPPILCDSGFTEFTELYPLPIFSLKKGSYAYNVNGTFQGVFTLVKDNDLLH